MIFDNSHGCRLYTTECEGAHLWNRGIGSRCENNHVRKSTSYGFSYFLAQSIDYDHFDNHILQSIQCFETADQVTEAIYRGYDDR
jgi:hypothetical protein